MTPRNQWLLAASLSVVLAASALTAHADLVWTTEDENSSLAGYQETDPTTVGLDISLQLARSGYCLSATAPGTYKTAPNGLNIRYEFGPDADAGDYFYMDVYQDTSLSPGDVSGDNYLNFNVRGDVDGQVMRVEVCDENWNESNYLLVGDYCGRGNGIESGEWHIVTIPLADFGSVPDYSSILVVSFTTDGGEAEKGIGFESLYVDDISFTADPLAARWPRDTE